MQEEKKKLLDVPVDVLALTTDPPLIRTGRVTCRTEGYCDVVLDEPEAAFQEGMKVIVDAGELADLRVVGSIGFIMDTKLHVESRKVVRRDKRIFPRMYGGIRVRYKVAPKEDEAQAQQDWISKGQSSDSDWFEPDPFMDFSGSGLMFEDDVHCKAEDLVLLELRVPPETELFRAAARVIRVKPIPPEERVKTEGDNSRTPPSHRIAVHFEELPPEAVEALMAFTLRVQDALI